LDDLYCHDKIQIKIVSSEFKTLNLANSVETSQGNILRLIRLDSALVFYKNGGVAVENEKREKTKNDRNEFMTLQKENLELQNENLKYNQTIRDQEARIRDLEEKNKTFELIKHYWWLLTLFFALGVFLAKIL